MTVCQALFIAPCSHVTHFACIRPLILKTYPGHTCPVCRTYADLEADVTIDEESEVEDELPVEASEDAQDLTVEMSALGLELVEAGSSAASALEVFGPGGVGVPLIISSHRALSRPSSIRSGYSGRGSASLKMTGSQVDHSPATVSSAELPLSIAIPSSSTSSGSPLLDDSLFNSATPSNTVFLSTLADRPTTLSTRRASLSTDDETAEESSLRQLANNTKGKGREIIVASLSDETA